ncbi:MAG: hypothetical protein ACK6AD_14860 [Cyanobacteriota bacterium]
MLAEVSDPDRVVVYDSLKLTVQMKLAHFSIPILAVASLALPLKSYAVSVGYQYTTTTTFSTTGENLTAVTLSFPRFDASIIPPDRTSIVLKGYNYVLSPATLGGEAGVACVTFISPGTCPVNGPFNVKATLTFNSMSGGTAPGFSPITESVAGPAPANATNNFALSTTANGLLSSDILFTSGQVPNFTQPPSTPLASLTGYQTAWSLQTAANLPVPSNVFGVWTVATVSGSIGVRYIYEYVPGPLPILGAGAAFSWSRRLRKRVKQAVSLHHS